MTSSKKPEQDQLLVNRYNTDVVQFLEQSDDIIIPATGGGILSEDQNKFTFTSEKELNKKQEKKQEKKQRNKANTNFDRKIDYNIDNELSEIIGKHISNDKELIKLFKACLKIFSIKDKDPSQILLILNKRAPKPLLAEIQKNKDLIKNYRQSLKSNDFAQQECKSHLNQLFKSQNVLEFQQIRDLLVQGKILQVFKQIQGLQKLTQSSKKNIIQTILNKQKIINHLKPKSSQKVLKDKLKQVIGAIQSIDTQTIQFFTSEIIKKNDVQFIRNLNDIPQLWHLTINRPRADRLIDIIKQIKEYGSLSLSKSQRNMDTFKFQFKVAMINILTFKVNLPLNKQSLDQKYGLITKLIHDPTFNISQYKDNFSRKNLNIILNEMKKPLSQYRKQKNYIQPLDKRKLKDINELLNRLRPDEKQIAKLTELLINDNYIQFFKSKQLIKDLVEIFNQYTALPNCMEALKKSNKDIEVLKADLRQNLTFIFSKYDLKTSLQKTFIKSILQNGNLLEVQKSNDIAFNDLKTILEEIQEDKTYSSYIQAAFASLPLVDEARLQIYQKLMNLPISQDDNIGIPQHLTFVKMKIITDRIIDTKNIDSIQSISCLTITEKPIVKASLKQSFKNKVNEKGKQEQTKIKQWIYGQGIDLELLFKQLYSFVYDLFRRKNYIDCKIFEQVSSKIKSTSSLDCINQQISLSQNTKQMLKNSIQKQNTFINYKKQFELKKKSSCYFDLWDLIDTKSGTLSKQFKTFIFTTLTQYLQIRPDIYNLRATDTKTIKQMITPAVQKAILNAVNNDLYHNYLLGFEETFESKQQQILKDLKEGIINFLDVLYREDVALKQNLKAALSPHNYKFKQILSIPNQDILEPELVTKLQKLPCVKAYDAFEFVSINRIDIIADYGFKRFIKCLIEKQILKSETKISIVDLFMNWNIKEVILHKDLTDNEKIKLFSEIIKSEEFQKCSKIKRDGRQKTERIVSGMIEIVNYCQYQNIEFNQDFKKLCKNNIRVQFSQDIKTLPVSTTFDLYKKQINLQQGIILYRAANLERLTQQTFKKYALNDDTLVLVAYKSVNVNFNNKLQKYEIPIGKSIVQSLKQQIPQLKNIQFEISSQNKNIAERILDMTINQILIEEIKQIIIDGKQYKHKNTQKFGDFKKQNNIKKNIVNQQGDIIADDYVMQNIKENKLSFKAQQLPLQQPKNNRVEQIKDYFINYPIQDENDPWFTIKKTKNMFDFAYNTIFENKNMKLFIQDNDTIPNLKQIRKRRICEFLQKKEQYKQYQQLCEIPEYKKEQKPQA